MVTSTFRFLKVWLITCTILIFAVMTITQYNSPHFPSMITDISTNLRISSRNQSCPQLSFSKHALPLTALASIPGSGNTWARHLIQQMTGIATGAIYLDKHLLVNGFPGEGVQNGSVIAIKTHKHFTPGYRKCVLVMRNPYEALIAEFNRRFSGENHTAFVKLEGFVKEWDRYFKRLSWVYEDFHMSWLAHKNMLLVLYNNLKENLEHELTRLLDFLQHSTKLTGDVQCALQNSEGSAKRDHSRRLPYEFFYSQDQIQTMNQVISNLSRAYSRRFPAEAVLMEKWKM